MRGKQTMRRQDYNQELTYLQMEYMIFMNIFKDSPKTIDNKNEVVSVTYGKIMIKIEL